MHFFSSFSYSYNVNILFNNRNILIEPIQHRVLVYLKKYHIPSHCNISYFIHCITNIPITIMTLNSPLLDKNPSCALLTLISKGQGNACSWDLRGFKFLDLSPLLVCVLSVLFNQSLILRNLIILHLQTSNDVVLQVKNAKHGAVQKMFF